MAKALAGHNGGNFCLLKGDELYHRVPGHADRRIMVKDLDLWVQAATVKWGMLPIKGANGEDRPEVPDDPSEAVAMKLVDGNHLRLVDSPAG